MNRNQHDNFGFTLLIVAAVALIATPLLNWLTQFVVYSVSPMIYHPSPGESDNYLIWLLLNLCIPLFIIAALFLFFASYGLGWRKSVLPEILESRFTGLLHALCLAFLLPVMIAVIQTFSGALLQFMFDRHHRPYRIEETICAVTLYLLPGFAIAAVFRAFLIRLRHSRWKTIVFTLGILALIGLTGVFASYYPDPNGIKQQPAAIACFASLLYYVTCATGDMVYNPSPHSTNAAPPDAPIL